MKKTIVFIFAGLFSAAAFAQNAPAQTSPTAAPTNNNQPQRGGGDRGGKGHGQGHGNGQMNHAPDMEGNAKRATDNMNAVCALSADQSAKIQAIYLNSAKERAAYRQAHPERTDADKEQMKTINQNKKAAIKAVLTPDQLAKWQAHNKAQMQGGQKGGAPKGGDDENEH